MAEAKKLVQLVSTPGIQRDGTMLDSESYTDGEWVRFQNGKPRKIGGFKWLSSTFSNIARSLKVYFRNGFTNVLIFDKVGCKKYVYDKTTFLQSSGQTVLSLELITLENCEDVWNELVDADATVSISTDAKEGTYSNKFVIAAGMAAGDIIATEAIATVDISSATHVKFWIKCSVNTSDADLQLLIDETASCATPSEVLDVPSLTANTWQEVTVALSAAAADLDAIISVGLKYTVDIGACDIYIDDIRAVLPTPTNDCDWSVSTMYDTVSGKTILMALQTFDIDNIELDTPGALYKSTDLSLLSYNSPLVLDTASSASGGCCVIGQCLFLYGSEGLIQNSNINKPFDLTVQAGSYANIAYVGNGNKIVYGAPIRSGSAPSGLFWSLDSLHKVAFTGGATNWSYSIIASDISILSKKCVVEYDGNFYWPGVDRYYVASSGSVNELPNTFNLDYFLKNVNREHTSKIWGTKIPRYGEIWWYFPLGDSTECNHAIVYNVREKFWYDLPISRVCGSQPISSSYPILADSNRLYLHEYGVNEVTDSDELAIRSSFTTATIDFLSSGQEHTNVNTVINRVEPDCSQVGSMSVSTVTRRYANSEDVYGTQYNFSQTTEKIDLREQARIMRLKMESNELNGDYWMGETFIHITPGDPRP